MMESTSATPNAFERNNFEQFVGDLLPKLNSIANSLTYPNVELAKDLVQDSIVKAFQMFKEGKLELSGKTIGWFATVIRNDFLMSKRKDKRLVEVPEEPDEIFPAHDGDRDFENANLRGILMDALSKLPEDQRDCVVLVDLHQFDYDEAAHALGIPVGTVRSRLSRARLKLAGQLSYLRQS